MHSNPTQNRAHTFYFWCKKIASTIKLKLVKHRRDEFHWNEQLDIDHRTESLSPEEACTPYRDCHVEQECIITS